MKRKRAAPPFFAKDEVVQSNCVLLSQEALGTVTKSQSRDVPTNAHADVGDPPGGYHGLAAFTGHGGRFDHPATGPVLRSQRCGRHTGTHDSPYILCMNVRNG